MLLEDFRITENVQLIVELNAPTVIALLRNTVSKSLFSKMFLIKRIVEKLPRIFKVKVIAPFWKSYVYTYFSCVYLIKYHVT